METFLKRRTDKWITFHVDWLKQFKKPLLVIRYENLKSDLLKEVGRICRFLGFEFTKRQRECVLNHAEGNFHRKHQKKDRVISKKQDLYLKKATQQVEKEIQNRLQHVNV